MTSQIVVGGGPGDSDPHLQWKEEEESQETLGR